jgi:TonB family protein
MQFNTMGSVMNELVKLDVPVNRPQVPFNRWIGSKFRLSGRTLPRYGFAIAISIVVHAAVITGYVGISALKQPDIMEIREITFIDLTEQEEQEKVPTTAQVKTTYNETARPAPLRSEPDNQLPVAETISQRPQESVPVLDKIRRQAPVNMATHAPIVLSQNQDAEVLKVSAAKGLHTDPVAKVPAPVASIQLQQGNRLSVPKPGTAMAFAGPADSRQPIVFESNSEQMTNPGAQKVSMAAMLPVKTGNEIKKEEKKSRAFITGALSNRAILHKSIPAFPRWAKIKGVGATISLQFTVMENGIVKENIVVLRTSGDKRWDDEVINALKEWQFVPLPAQGRKDQSGVITFQFVIE